MSDLLCGHDSKFGVLLLPEEDHGCLACGYERLTTELAAANKLIDDEKTGKMISYLNVLAQENKTLRRMSHADRAEKAEAERDALREALEEINLMACYASEEDTDSREAMLLKIGESARAAIDAARAKG